MTNNLFFKRSHVLLLVLVGLCLWSGACAPSPGLPRLEGMLPTPAQAVERLEARRVAVRSFVMQGEIEVETPEGSLYGDHLIQGVYPGRLRVEVVGPMGRMALRLVCDGVNLTVLDYHNNRAYRGPATRTNLARFLGLSLSVSEIYALLSGNVPLLRDYSKSLESGPSPGLASLSLLAPGGMVEQTLIFSLADYHIRSAWLQGWEGGYGLSCDFEEQVKSGPGVYPLTIRLADDQKRRVNIINQSLTINQPVDGIVFEVGIPAGVMVKELP